MIGLISTKRNQKIPVVAASVKQLRWVPILHCSLWQWLFC